MQGALSVNAEVKIEQVKIEQVRKRGLPPLVGILVAAGASPSSYFHLLYFHLSYFPLFIPPTCSPFCALNYPRYHCWFSTTLDSRLYA